METNPMKQPNFVPPWEVPKKKPNKDRPEEPNRYANTKGEVNGRN